MFVSVCWSDETKGKWHPTELLVVFLFPCSWFWCKNMSDVVYDIHGCFDREWGNEEKRRDDWRGRDLNCLHLFLIVMQMTVRKERGLDTDASSSLLASIVLLFSSSSSCNFFPLVTLLYRHLPEPPDSFMRLLSLEVPLYGSVTFVTVMFTLFSCSLVFVYLIRTNWRCQRRLQITLNRPEARKSCRCLSSSNDNCYC